MRYQVKEWVLPVYERFSNTPLSLLPVVYLRACALLRISPRSWQST
jgi:hypothetical protein